MTPCLGSMNLLERLAELRNIFTGSPVYCNRLHTSQEEPDGREAQGHLQRQGPEISVPLWMHRSFPPPCVHQSGSCLNPVLWGFYGGSIT